MVLQELRRSIRADAQPVPRIGSAARLFFTPLEPFLIDAPPDHKRLGRVARVSLEPIWTWLGRDLIPADAKALSDNIHRALLAGDQAGAEQLAHTLQDRAAQRIREIVAETGFDERSRRRLAVHVGTPRALEDLNAIASSFECRDVIADLGRRMPSHIRNFEREQIDAVRAFLDNAASHLPAEPRGCERPICIYAVPSW